MSASPKNILITGGSGFLGPLLAAKLLKDPSETYHVVLTDLQTPPQPSGLSSSQNLTLYAADLTSPDAITKLLSLRPTWHAIFLFHGIMSLGCEENPALSTRVNLHATQSLLDAIIALPQSHSPALGGKPRILYASTQAVYGPPSTTSGPITDSTPPTPVSVYGTHKLILETHLNDLHRRALVSAFSLRLPTVTVRPGAPSRSAAAWISGIARDTLAGLECLVPVADPEHRQVICSPRVVLENFVRMMRAPDDALPSHTRAVYLPGVSVTLGEMYAAVEKVCGKAARALCREERDAEAERLLESWPRDGEWGIARRLGLVFDESAEQVYGEYVEGLKGGR